MKLTALLGICLLVTFLSTTNAATLNGVVLDAETKLPLAARVYIQNSNGKFFHVTSEGTAIPYRKVRQPNSIEVHTTISARPFQAEQPAGNYTVTVERGKEYLRSVQKVSLRDNQPTSIKIPLRRWTNMAAKGWYSGETHVHRKVEELPTIQLAEDINVAFPLTAWVTDSAQTPATHNKNPDAVPPAKLFRIDRTHVFWPVNTEYEIFSINRKRHTLGAAFILNHKKQFTLPAPPVVPIAKEARAQGGILELDKHNWPWSMMLVPQMNVELFELANNHMWRTEFLYNDWYPEYVADFMNVETRDGKFTERGWIQFGFENYYALLNCGFRMQPTAGTASGVHPVPFGFGRVYVHIDGNFTYRKWLEGLLSGRSFVTTGPMLMATATRGSDNTVTFSGDYESSTKPTSLEVLVNGRVAKSIKLKGKSSDTGTYQTEFNFKFKLQRSSWVAARAFAEREGGKRMSFAHTAPIHFEVSGKPLRPTQNQRDYLVSRVRNEIERNRGWLDSGANREFEEALRTFQAIEPESDLE